MNVNQLHKITTALRAKKQGGIEVMINHSTFAENDIGSILPIESARVRRVQGADDGGPTGPKYPFLVIEGDCQA